NCRPEDGAVGVGRLLAEEDELGLLARERAREDLARGDEIGAGRSLVADEDGAVGAHGERLAERVGGPLRADRDDDHLVVAVALQPQRLLDGVRVEVVERSLTRPVEALRAGIDPALSLRDVLDADSNLHAADPNYMRVLRASTSETKTLLTL